ncbi:related to CDC33 - translation initiation factor eIF4E [Cephalotrichum gorgonifer]|uniref:Related to CDC33 - translation initiation factor eIF4E n=1 Tax=Cephalotrichum gorgonifer TaxID=2041049 RepID=A0AAE8SRE6_9PEZI|nr:related to CDC33 - translation initiation factor eIF4E [Cephalotrichum gorgonifer]
MDNLWTRRTVSNTKLSLTTNNPPNGGAGDGSSRNTSFQKRVGNDPQAARTSSATTPGGGMTASPGAAAFGLGSGAFASFSVGSKTPKSPGNPFEAAMGQVGAKTPSADKNPAKDSGKLAAASSGTEKRSETTAAGPVSHPLVNKWVFWWRPPISKSQGFVDYEKTLRPMCHCGTVEEFFDVYSHLKNPSKLPTMSEYHFFKFGIRPIWEDDVNKKGGKWVVRLKKGVVDRYWEDLILALIGEQFGDAGDEVCGAVANVRNGEDVISIWTRNDGGRVIKIRETMKRILNLPPSTRVEFKSHDSAIQQRVAVEESRHSKRDHHQGGSGEKRHQGHQNRSNNSDEAQRQSTTTS